VGLCYFKKTGRFPCRNTPGVSEAKGAGPLLRNSLRALLGRAPYIFRCCPQEPAFNYRKSYRYYYRFVHQSDRGFCRVAPPK
jgi:hypothetical protein